MDFRRCCSVLQFIFNEKQKKYEKKIHTSARKKFKWLIPSPNRRTQKSVLSLNLATAAAAAAAAVAKHTKRISIISREYTEEYCEFFMCFFLFIYTIAVYVLHSMFYMSTEATHSSWKKSSRYDDISFSCSIEVLSSIF